MRSMILCVGCCILNSLGRICYRWFFHDGWWAEPGSSSVWGGIAEHAHECQGMWFSRKQVISTNPWFSAKCVTLCVQMHKVFPPQEHLTHRRCRCYWSWGVLWGGLSGGILGHLCVCGGVLLEVSWWRWLYRCPWASSLVLKNLEFRLEGTLGLVVECEVCLGLLEAFSIWSVTEWRMSPLGTGFLLV